MIKAPSLLSRLGAFLLDRHGEHMISKLLDRDRTIWSVAAALYLLAGLLVVLGAGPLSWTIRSISGGSAGSAGVHIGLVAGALLLGSVFSFLAARRARTKVVPVVAALAGVAAGILGVTNLVPFWLGFLALIPVAVAVVGYFGTRGVFRYHDEIEADAKKPRGERKHSGIDPSRMQTAKEPDLALSAGAGALSVAVGLIGALTVSTMTTWFAPELPADLQADGQVVVGEGNDVDVKILYGINYPHSAQLLGDDDSVLKGLVDDGKVQLTLQGVSKADESRLSVPVREGEACAYELKGSEGAFQYIVNYNQALAGSNTSSQVEDLAASAGSDLGVDFKKCMQSGKYELQAGKALEQSSKYADGDLPQIFINGEQVQPESLGDLKKMISKAE